MATLDTLIKHTHRLIRTPYLHLHKIRFPKRTLWAYCHGPIDILPCLFTAQYIIHFFTIGAVGSLDLGIFNLLRVGTGWAGEDVGGRCFISIDDLEQRSIKRAEPHLLLLFVVYILYFGLMDGCSDGCSDALEL